MMRRKISSITFYSFIFLLSLLCSSICASAQSGTWSGNLEVQGMKLPLVFHLNEEGASVDSPDQGVKGIPAEMSLDASGQLTVRISSLNAEYKGILKGDTIEGVFTQNGFSFPLNLTKGENKRNRPQTPIPPFPYTEEEVTFRNGDAVLKGTLTLPKDYTRQTPVLIMVTGSGLQNRDEEIFEHKPFAVLADAMARARIASLRYDDRGFGESTGDVNHMTTADLKNDALAGIEWLRKRFDNVGVLGHSEGGTIALMLAAEKKADFIVSLAAMVLPGSETLLWQNREIFSKTGIPKEVVDSYCQLLADTFEAMEKGTAMPSVDNYNLTAALKQNYMGVLRQLQLPYLQYFLSLDMRPLLSKVTVPVLALNGTKDTQVDYKGNLDALRAGLPMNKATQIKALEGLNHLFQHCSTGDTSEYVEIEETIAPEVLQDVVDFVLTIRK